MHFKPRPWSSQPSLTPVVQNFLQNNLLLECSPPTWNYYNESHLSKHATGIHDLGPSPGLQNHSCTLTGFLGDGHTHQYLRNTTNRAFSPELNTTLLGIFFNFPQTKNNRKLLLPINSYQSHTRHHLLAMLSWLWIWKNSDSML